jgi:hypothetical protein
MKYLFLFSILLFNNLFSETFYTALGKCNLEIYDGKVDQIPDIENLIIKESQKLIDQIGNVEPRPFSIYITGNMDEFNSRSKGPIAEWGIAVAKLNPERIIIKSPGIANISFSRLKEVIIHELNHIYMFRIPDYYSIPSWFKEGMAMESANEFSLLHKIEISKSYWNNKIIPLKRLNNFRSLSNNQISLAYAESAASIEALKYYYGDEAPENIINHMNTGKNFIESIEYIIGEGYVDFQIKFENFIEDNYNLVFLLGSNKYLYIILPFILILGFIFKKYKNMIKLQQWEIEEELEALNEN